MPVHIREGLTLKGPIFLKKNCGGIKDLFSKLVCIRRLDFVFYNLAVLSSHVEVFFITS